MERDYDKLEERMRLVEAEQIVHRGQINELVGWRRRDEPKLAELANTRAIELAVTKAIGARASAGWKRWHKIGIAVSGAVMVSGNVVGMLAAMGVHL